MVIDPTTTIDSTATFIMPSITTTTMELGVPPVVPAKCARKSNVCLSAEEKAATAPVDNWYYPAVFANDLKDVDLPQKVKDEVVTTAFEYARTVIPTYTNWKRYVAFMRTIIIGTIAEFRGNMVDVMAGDEMLGYNLTEVLDGLFAGTRGHTEMAREYRSFLLFTADKTSDRREDELFRRYVNALAGSPRNWFRLRETDALARFTIAAALACNDLDDIWFTEQQFEIMCEIGDTLYDAIAFFKHRSEGETNNTFQYSHPELRVAAVRQCREVLWALDCAWVEKPELCVVTNFIRYFGGPLFVTMRRYRFIEDDCTIGNKETADVVAQARQNRKLWNRIDEVISENPGIERYHKALEAADVLMFEGQSDMLKAVDDPQCGKCESHNTFGSNELHTFGGVKLCDGCKGKWALYMEDLPRRAVKAFPEMNSPAVVGKIHKARINGKQ
ncbi:ABA 3 [Pyrenophora seminiperda CCB06]|uniref:ABA 3 n=1 Tax=Pyrenophora seminiperda CCB06 TaxID=1302712 RepID=A0A3M7MFL5_9PLEO|nr:ABA 3 [Pyrenophora seminiperda CCB06]